MFNEYLIVNKKILPSYFEKVVEARSLLESRKCKSISEAVKKVGISRSTYYKYKDYIFEPSNNTGHRFSVSMIMKDVPGILSKILKEITDKNISIVTIHQEIPINSRAVVIMTLDATHMEIEIEEFIMRLLEIKDIYEVTLLAME